MAESKTIERMESPNTRETLVRDLRLLGLEAGQTILVHSSLSSMGWVSGGPVAVAQALMDVVTASGTLVMPTHSSGLTEPSRWANPPVPSSWWEIIRQSMPAFDEAFTPSQRMGAIPETFRSFPGVQRSSHPTGSFAAWGLNAHSVVGRHDLQFSLGEGSPLARIYDLSGWVLLLGVGHDRNTSLHLSEIRAEMAPVIEQGSPILENGCRVWKSYPEYKYDSDSFVELGAAVETKNEVQQSLVGAATCKLIRQRDLVDFGVRWFADRGGNAHQ
jgi:aminoglycoside 3-N-acetyltransferase